MNKRNLFFGVLFISATLLLFGFLPGCSSSSSRYFPPTPTSTPTPSGWSWFSIHPSQTDYRISLATCIHNGKIGGCVIRDFMAQKYFPPFPKDPDDIKVDHPRYAAYWTTPNAASFINLINGENLSMIRAVSDNRQVGFFIQFPAFWQGVYMNPPNLIRDDQPFNGREAYGLSGNWACGYGFQGEENQSVACLWNLQNDTFVNLAPQGYLHSQLFAIYGATDTDPGIQVGCVDQMAAMWHGTAGSCVNLHPEAIASQSFALAVYGNQQGGSFNASSDGNEHAAIWSGSSNTVVDLHPVSIPEITGSRVYGMTDGIQVGSVDNGLNPNAFLWRGSPGDYLSLHSLLPERYSISEAFAVEKIGNDLWVVGTALNIQENIQEAIVWHYTAP